MCVCVCGGGGGGCRPGQWKQTICLPKISADFVGKNVTKYRSCTFLNSSLTGDENYALYDNDNFFHEMNQARK